MKFIDKRGMVFGKINIIDLIVVLFILCLTPMFYFGWKIFNKPQSHVQVNWKLKYDEEIAKREETFKEHPRLRKYFK